MSPNHIDAIPQRPDGTPIEATNRVSDRDGGAGRANPNESPRMVDLRALSASDPVTILYTNWRGETAVRRIALEMNDAHIAFGSNEWHREPQWLIHATDVEKGEGRDFALSGIKAWGQEAVDAALARPFPAAGVGTVTEEMVEAATKALRTHHVRDGNRVSRFVCQECTLEEGVRAAIEEAFRLADDAPIVGWRARAIAADQDCELKHARAEFLSREVERLDDALQAAITQPRQPQDETDDGSDLDVAGQSYEPRLNRLRIRLEAALQDRTNEGDGEAVSWLSDGIEAIDSVFRRIAFLRRCLKYARAEAEEARATPPEKPEPVADAGEVRSGIDRRALISELRSGINTPDAAECRYLADLVEADAHPSRPASAEDAQAVREAFRRADEQDWSRLLEMIDDSGHGRFWKDVFAEVRSVLSDPAPRGDEP